MVLAERQTAAVASLVLAQEELAEVQTKQWKELAYLAELANSLAAGLLEAAEHTSVGRLAVAEHTLAGTLTAEPAAEPAVAAPVGKAEEATCQSWKAAPPVG